MKKKLFIIPFIIIVIVLFVVLFINIYNSNPNKLKRYLIDNGYNCNNNICSKSEKGVQYYLNYRTGYYKIEDKVTISFEKDHLTLSSMDGNVNCIYNVSKDGVNKEEIYYKDEDAYICRDYLTNISQEYEKYRQIFVNADIDFSTFK